MKSFKFHHIGLPLLVIACISFTTACASRPDQLAVADLEYLSQNPQDYLDPVTAGQLLMSSSRQQDLAAEFLQRFFAAWYADGPLVETSRPFWAADWIRNNPVYAENLRPMSGKRVEELIKLADLPSYPSEHRRALTLTRSNIRALPTHNPAFNNPRSAGEGFPFDYLQHGILAANTPVLVTHRSKDGSWAFIETALLYGWLPITELAWVDDDFVENFITDRYVTLTRDKVAVFDLDGIYRFSADIGTLLPIIADGAGHYQVYVAVADRQRQAQLVKATIAVNDSALFPVPLTPQQIALLAGRMMGQLYGWGEMFGNRDCSALIRDLYAPFGLWIPRNSSQQARVGEVIEMTELTPHQREEQLLNRGVPFLTLVRLPGHIMLYLGGYDERAVVLHSIWGLRTRTFSGSEGRLIVGETVITGLEPGLENSRLTFDVGSLRKRISSINILGQSGGDD